MRNSMLILAGCFLMAGCDYTAPLVTKPDLGIDNAVIGLWQKGEAGKAESLLVLPFSEREYLIVFPAGSKDAMYARGCLWRDESLTLVQMDWFGTAKATLPKDKRTFQFAAFEVAGDLLKVRFLNPDVVSINVSTTDALVQAITDHRNDPKLFRDEMVFRKVGDESGSDSSK